jgi:hypothetical protein
LAAASALATLATPAAASADNGPVTLQTQKLDAVRQKVARGEMLSAEDLKLVAASFKRSRAETTTSFPPSWE